MKARRSNASVRRAAISTFMIALALGLHGVAPAGSRPEASSPASPRPSPSHTVRPRVTQTPRPHPTSTDPYPGGGVNPNAALGGSFFHAADTAPASGIGRNDSSLMWIALALFGLGLVIRWFFIASRDDDTG